ncbi:C69 family dipeptidase [Hoministercoradaptatus ammoniilyticus]|nr:C69 family dipeptidase [Hoministercoradaptatus ammoniilyticus]
MACTTILVGKKASYDGSTMIARNDDSGSGHFTAKKFTVVTPKEQPKTYVSVLSHVKVELPEQAMRYTSMPNAEKGEGIWAASGVNEANVAMTATETITTNPRVQGADPLVVYQPAKDGQEEVPGGIGEEDIVCLVLPYIKSAREGVARLGQLLETYGTYENNGIAFQDADEIWWLETIGGHHWMARRVPDDVYVVMPNQLGIDTFDLEDALGEQKEYMCSPDLKEFIEKYHLDLSMDGVLNPRDAFGSHDDSDHVYNTPRAWYMERYLNPNSVNWDGPDADYTPLSDDIPWCMVPEKKITPEWVAYASNAFNTMVPFYADVDEIPEYLANTTGEVSTENFYWTSRMIAAMADASYGKSLFHVEHYQENVLAKSHALINQYDALLADEKDPEKQMELKRKANRKVAEMVQKEASATLKKVLYELSNQMKNSYARSDV